jgi:hypothetical protein
VRTTTLVRGAADVELWHALLDVDGPQLATLVACLSTHEMQRASLRRAQATARALA